MKRPMIERDEYVISAWATNCSGPGWSNSPVIALIGKKGEPGTYRELYIQPEEQGADLLRLHKIATIVTQELTASVKSIIGTRKS